MNVKKVVISAPRLKEAYTTVEVVFASAILALLFVSLHLGIAFGFSVSRAERENLRATQIMLERMEGIRLFTFDQLSDTNLNPAFFTKSYYPAAMGGQSPGITYTGRVTVVPNITMDPTTTYSGDMKTVTVQLDWVSSNVHRTRSLTTYAARNGIQNYVISTNQ
jgi:hypothetical protein